MAKCVHLRRLNAVIMVYFPFVFNELVTSFLPHGSYSKGFVKGVLHALPKIIIAQYLYAQIFFTLNLDYIWQMGSIACNKKCTHVLLTTILPMAVCLSVAREIPHGLVSPQ